MGCNDDGDVRMEMRTPPLLHSSWSLGIQRDRQRAVRGVLGWVGKRRRTEAGAAGQSPVAVGRPGPDFERRTAQSEARAGPRAGFEPGGERGHDGA